MISDEELREIVGLNTDGIEGFRAQMRERRDLEVLWPEHLRGVRIDNFRRGAEIARSFLHYQRTLGNVRRRVRMEDFKDKGATTTLIPKGEDRRAEELENLRTIARRFS